MTSAGNLLTEDEAKTKWCPLARYDDNDNRDATNDAEYSPCIASACMAWRVSAPGQDLSEAKEHLGAGRFIEAIRSFRAATGSPLKESKDALEQIRDGGREWPSAEDKGFCGAFALPLPSADRRSV